MMTFEQAKKTRAGRKEISMYSITNAEEWLQWVRETREYWKNEEQAMDIADMDGLTIEEIEDLIL